MAPAIDEGGIEKGLMTPTKHNQNSNHIGEPSPSPSPSAATPPALVLSNSGKRMDQAGKKKYVKQVTGRHNDTELHLAAQKGDLAAVKQILDDIDSQMVGTLSGADFDAEVAEIRASVVNEVNELGETALYTAAEKGHLEVVKELLKYSDKETITRKNRLEFDTLHIAASQGYDAIVQLLLDHDPSLCQTRSKGNATPLITAATKGHTAVVKELLSKDRSLLDIARSNGKNALHLAARVGHVEIVKALLDKDPLLARRTDRKGQTALHMAAKGVSSEVVKLLLEADAAIVNLPDKSDKSGFTALHVATRKKRAEIVKELLSLPDTSANVNALTRDHKTALDIADMFLMEEFNHLKIQLQDIISATDNFSPNNLIGHGGFGKVYKGEISLSEGRTMVALKRLDRQFGQGNTEFWKEIMMLSKCKHENLVSLLHFCFEGDERILVYEYASRGSLDRHLSDGNLTWMHRLKICVGAARGLNYLHDPRDTKQRVLHRDIKSSNILLDEEWNAKVSDFGLSKVGPANQPQTYLVSNAVGTFGYCDPSYFETGFLSKASDVYSFGVVLFEVMCGRLCCECHNGEMIRILVHMWRKCFEENKLDDIIFSSLKEQIQHDSLMTFSTVANRCLQRDHTKRPTMVEIIQELEVAIKQQLGII